jgi:hypothetical protein
MRELKSIFKTADLENYFHDVECFAGLRSQEGPLKILNKCTKFLYQSSRRTLPLILYIRSCSGIAEFSV